MADKRCSKCRECKPKDQFYALRRAKDGLHSWCKECVKRRLKDKYVEKLRDDPDGFREKRRATHTAWRSGLRLRTTPPPGTPEWEERHRWSRCLSSAKHQAKRFGAAVMDLTLDEWIDIVDAHEHRCFYCNAYGSLWVEHITALFNGGDHTKANVVPACPDCNRRKSKNSPEYFLANKCHRGHDLAGNVYVFPDGKKKVCKTCRLGWFRAHREKKQRRAA